MHIQVARNGTKQGFPMTSPHVLDGFFLDIPQGLQGVAEERLLFDVMSRLEPRFLWGNLHQCVYHHWSRKLPLPTAFSWQRDTAKPLP